MDKLIHDIRCALDIIIVCITMCMQEDGTGKGPEEGEEREKEFRQAQNNRIGMMFLGMKRISMNAQISRSEELRKRKLYQ